MKEIAFEADNFTTDCLLRVEELKAVLESLSDCLEDINRLPLDTVTRHALSRSESLVRVSEGIAEDLSDKLTALQMVAENAIKTA